MLLPLVPVQPGSLTPVGLAGTYPSAVTFPSMITYPGAGGGVGLTLTPSAPPVLVLTPA